jgi:hypothetical protein
MKPLKPHSSFLYMAGLGVLTLSFCLALDALVFHGRLLYPKYLSPNSSTGSFELALDIEKNRHLTQPFRALLFGDSQLAEGFSAVIANRYATPQGIEFASVASAGAMLRTSYFLVRDLDPSGRRYNVLLVGLRDYADIDAEDKNDRATDLNWVIARLRWTDILPFALSYDDPVLRLRALEGGLFKGTIFRSDLRDLLRHRKERWHEVRENREHGADWRDSYGGSQHSLIGLTMDTVTGEVHVPEGTPPEAAQELRERLRSPGAPGRGLESAYRKQWLLPLIQRYSENSAKVIIYRIPQRPLPLPDPVSQPENSFVGVSMRDPKVTVLDEHLFDDLQRPENFFDGLHMNAKGRAEFSRRLAEVVVRLVKPGPDLSTN